MNYDEGKAHEIWQSSTESVKPHCWILPLIVLILNGVYGLFSCPMLVLVKSIFTALAACVPGIAVCKKPCFLAKPLFSTSFRIIYFYFFISSSDLQLRNTAR